MLHNTGHYVLISFCLAEDIFWVWALAIRQWHPTFSKVIPSQALRNKMRQDTLEAVGDSSEGWKVFLEGWFIRDSNRNVQITDIKRENLGDW